jgi:uncharacterized protein
VIKLLVFTLVGLGAQIVDGTLGMAFGVTATTLLVFTGVGAAHASAAVHFAEVATTLASGVSHWRFGNVDKRVLLRLGIPGGIGAFLGATVLSRLSTESAAPITAGILLAIGVYLIYRFSTNPPRGNYAPTTPRRGSWPRWACSADSSTPPAAVVGGPSRQAPCSRAGGPLPAR